MGNYATSADFIARFDDEDTVAHLTGTPETGPDLDRINEWLQSSESELDSYIVRRHDVPVDVSLSLGLAQVMKGMTLDMAVWKALGDRASEKATAAWKNAIAWAEKVAKGVIELPAAVTLASTQARDPIHAWGTGADVSSSSTRKFTRDSQAGL
jgi:phage gp36-like protein